MTVHEIFESALAGNAARLRREQSPSIESVIKAACKAQHSLDDLPVLLPAIDYSIELASLLTDETLFPTVALNTHHSWDNTSLDDLWSHFKRSFALTYVGQNAKNRFEFHGRLLHVETQFHPETGENCFGLSEDFEYGYTRKIGISGTKQAVPIAVAMIRLYTGQDGSPDRSFI